MTEVANVVAEKHSGVGVASFVTSIIASTGMIFLYVVAAYMHVASGGGIDETSSGAMVLGLFIMLFFIVLLISVGLGIAGLVQKNTKKIFPLLGTIFSSVVFLITGVVMAIGMAS